jgi:HlyD family secretion protein
LIVAIRPFAKIQRGIGEIPYERAAYSRSRDVEVKLMRRMKWFQLALAAALALGGLAFWASRTTTEVQVTTAAVTTGPIIRRVVAAGTLQAETTVEVGVQVSGVVQPLTVDYNSLVHAGQVVATLDPASYTAQLRVAEAARAQTQAAVARAQADVLQFKTQVEDAQKKLTRAEALSAKQIIPLSDLEDARVASDEAHADLSAGQAVVAEAEAAITQAEAAVEQAQVNVEHTIIRSPIDGIVIDREVDVGQTLAASMQSPVLFRIATDITQMQVQVDVDESDVGGLVPGEPVSFDVESYPDETFHGSLSQVRLQPTAEQAPAATAISSSTAAQGPTGTAAVVTYMAIVHVANPNERLRPGMTAVVTLNGLRRESAIRVPNSALAFRPPAAVLQALGNTKPRGSASATRAQGERSPTEVWEFDGQQFTPISVRSGLSDDGWTELLGGSIRPGDALVTSAVVLRHRRFRV